MYEHHMSATASHITDNRIVYPNVIENISNLLYFPFVWRFTSERSSNSESFSWHDILRNNAITYFMGFELSFCSWLVLSHKKIQYNTIILIRFCYERWKWSKLPLNAIYAQALVGHMVFCRCAVVLITKSNGKRDRYRKISNIRRTNSQNSNASRLGLQVSSRYILKPSVKWRMKM